MSFLLFLSETMIPLLIFVIIGYGVLNHQPVYEEFISGAKKGLKMVIQIMPTLIGLMMATGLLLDIYKTYGADSRIGKMASVMLSSTETIFYTMSVYFMSVKVKKTRYTIPGALLATLAGTIASVWIVTYMR